MSGKSVVDAFTSFAAKHGDEVLDLAEVLTTMLGGLALPPTEQVKVEEFIENMRGISSRIKKAKPLAKITINKADITEAVSKALPSVVKESVATAVKGELPAMIEEAVAKAVASAMAAAATDAAEGAE